MEELFKKRKEQLAFFKELRNKVTIPKKVPVPKGIYNSCPKCPEGFFAGGDPERAVCLPALRPLFAGACL